MRFAQVNTHGKAPKQVVRAYATRERTVSEVGLAETQKIPGYHDEPLQGYRGFYRIMRDSVEFVLVEEVNKHDYKKIERLFGA